MAMATDGKEQISCKKKKKKMLKKSIFCCSILSAGCCGCGSKGVVGDPILPEIIIKRAAQAAGKTTAILAQPLAAKSLLPNNYNNNINKRWKMFGVKDKDKDKDKKEAWKPGPAAGAKSERKKRGHSSVDQGRRCCPCTTTTKLSHSAASLPSPWKKEDSDSDSMVGAATLTVTVTLTLIIVVVCGKACAILCTAAWLYFIPRLHYRSLPIMDMNNTNTNKIRGELLVDLDSWEYKNKVVLRGLLQRDHHHHL
ncbi:uncharacterized protein LOC127245543 isoform X2 [Andrographis paniculata]|uniref:uncharacterized protein LOC127245543 isoform X2 n=1 Tax=Andrographis paniculata TaxID=175694 RepID=UPI0021E74D1D|nr:uncharacterized protein LOC127245543 isoform X2 [Andrographis paniculata]